MQVHLTDQILSINAHCNVTLYIQKSVSENAHISVLRVEKYKHFSGGEYPQIPLVHTIPHQTFCHQQPSVISPHSV